MHPHLLEFLRLYKYDAQIVIEGMLFEDSQRHDAVRTMGLYNPCNTLVDIANIPATTYRYEYPGTLQHYYDKRYLIAMYVSQKVSEERPLSWFVKWNCILKDIRNVHRDHDDRGVTNNNASE